MVAPGDGLLRVSIQMLLGTKSGMPLLHMIQLILGISIKRFPIFRYTDILRGKIRYIGIRLFHPPPPPPPTPHFPPLREYFCHQVTKHSTTQTSFSRFSEYTLHGLYLIMIHRRVFTVCRPKKLVNHWVTKTTLVLSSINSRTTDKQIGETHHFVKSFKRARNFYTDTPKMKIVQFKLVKKHNLNCSNVQICSPFGNEC